MTPKKTPLPMALSRNIGRRPSEALIEGIRNGVITATEAMSISPGERTVTATEIGAPQLTAPDNGQNRK